MILTFIKFKKRCNESERKEKKKIKIFEIYIFSNYLEDM